MKKPLTFSGGFTLLEVMIGLVVLSIGLLGIVKLESAAIGSTTVAAKRSLAALEGDSLAAMMHVNHGYWTSTDPVNSVITITGSTVTATTGAANLATSIAAAPVCDNTHAGPCTVTDMAAYDLKQWALLGLQPLLPNYTAVVSCNASTPIACTINITWSETSVATNSQETNIASASLQNPSYSLYVEP
jgi:type IV pilus assembly protein PilV